MVALRYLYLLALVLWLGGMVVLGAVVAPSTFQVLQSLEPQSGRALAGEVFGTALARFAYVSYACAGVMIVTLTIMGLLGPRPQPFLVRGILLVVMLGIALYAGIVVASQISLVQQEAGGLPSMLAAADPRRLRFDGLHALSERLMTVNVLAALALLFMEARTNE
jgi:uncharacterized membrane protein